MKRLLGEFLMLATYLCLTTSFSPAQRGSGVMLRTITMEDGLPANSVRSVVQDKYGVMWFGTDNGLCRYDGYHVQPFSIPQLGFDQYVSALAASDEGMLVGTSKGAYLLAFRTEQFSPLGGHIPAVVTSFATDAEGDLWISTAGEGVYCYHPHQQTSKQYRFPENRNMIACVFCDDANQIWALSNSGSQGLYRLNKAKNTFERIEVKGASAVGMAMAQDAPHQLLIGTWDQGLVRLHADGKVETLLSPSIQGVGLHIHSLTLRSQTELLIGCDEGLICYNLQQNSWQHMTAGATSASHTSKGNSPAAYERFVYGAMQDAEGGIWMGTFYGGVSYFPPMAGRFPSYTEDEGLRGHVVSRFAEDDRHRVWVATDDGGLNCFDEAQNRFVDYATQATMRGYNVHGLWAEGNELWVGTYADGIVRLNTQTGQRRTYHLDNTTALSSCYAIYRDSHRRLWAASMDGINIFDERQDRFKPMKSLGMLTIDIKEDRQGNLWFATQGGGLWRYTRQGKWRQYHFEEKDTCSLPSYQVNSLCLHENGTLYVATGDGLCTYDAAHDRFHRIDIACDGHDFSSIVFNQDEIWIASTHGILRYVEGEHTLAFNKYDGLQSNQFRPNAALMTADGRIFMGTVQGFHAFYPYQIKVNKKAPSVFISSVELYGEQLSVNTKRLPEALNHTEQLNLYHGDDMFSIAFASLSYVSPEKNQYAYRLDGFDHDWIYAGSEHKATYTNIPAGTYTFRVKATNNDGLWSAREATLKIVVHPPFWWSLPAKVVYVLLLALIVYLFTQMRLKKEKARHLREMQQLHERQEQEIRDQRLSFFTMIAHEIRTPVTLIIGPLETLKSEWERLSQDLQKGETITSTLDVIDRNAQRLLNLVNQLLDFNKVQQQGLQMHFRLNNISRMMHAVAERFEPTLQHNGATLTVSYPADDFAAVIDNEAITKVISNLMTNATKYTKSRVHLSCEVIDGSDEFRIAVADDGIGISADEQQKIFAPFYQARDNKPGTGIGLDIVSRLVKAHHGRVEVESAPGQGSTFFVTLPISQPDVEIAEPSAFADDTELSDTSDSSETSDASESAKETENAKEAALPTMLIVEDDEDMRHFVKSHFSSTYKVLEAEDGVQALRQLKAHKVQLIVSDWMMPQMDGAELCRRVRADQTTSHIPFIMLTAKTDNDSKTEGMNCGADTYIEKPFSMKYLEACIRNLLEMRRLLQEKFSHTPLDPITEIAPTPVDNEFLLRLNKKIEENIDKTGLNVAFLAEQMGMSRSTLFAKIKGLADVTPNEMIQLVRLKKAASLLREQKYRINEVAYMVGFSSPSYFTKCFTKQFGIKPAEFAAGQGA